MEPHNSIMNSLHTIIVFYFVLFNIIVSYYTTKTVRGPITKFNQPDYFIAGLIFSKYRTGYCPECVKLIAAL